MPFKVTDEQIIAAWNPAGDSPSRVAQALGLNVRTLQERRVRIQHGGKKLPTYDPRRPKYNQAKQLITADKVEVQLEIPDGVVLVGSDAHYWPGIIPTMHRAMIDLCGRLKPRAVILNGDLLDGASISRFDSIGWEHKPTMKEELDTVRDRTREIFDASPGARHVMPAGNHDLRFETRFAAQTPQMAGIQGLHLKDHLPEWTPAWFCSINPGTSSFTVVTHNDKGGREAAWNNALKNGCHFVTGHTHQAVVRMVNRRNGDRHYGVEAGMMADSARGPQFYNYLRANQPETWTSALAVLTYRDGCLMLPELALRIDDSRYEFRSEIINV